MPRCVENACGVRGGTSYGTIWPGGAADPFFNVALFNYGATTTGKLVRNSYDMISLNSVIGLSIVGGSSTTSDPVTRSGTSPS